MAREINLWALVTQKYRYLPKHVVLAYRKLTNGRELRL